MATQIKIRLEIDVTGHLSDGTRIAGLVNDALRELTNRKDFRDGTIKTGRVVDHSSDHNDKRTTIDMFRMVLVDGVAVAS